MANPLYTEDTPKEISSADGLRLLTQNSPNGQATQILLEELADAYRTSHDTTLSPPFPIFETSAQLLYLLQFYDKENRFRFTDEFEKSEALQWLFFWHSSDSPYQSQVHFFKDSTQKTEYVINRSRNETLKVFGVLESQLSGIHRDGEPKDYIIGKGKGKYSHLTGFTDEEMSKFPHLLKWIDRIAAREAVRRGTGDKYTTK
ncbi:glutathione S-transferase [Hypomontagnella monticulosa]|nr:glutathione S-transferase [Hypomontagnella monticulosa]